MKTGLAKQNKGLRRFIKPYKDNWQLMLMFLPGLLTLILFCYYPMYGVLIAFKDFKMLRGITGSEWVGFEHFARLFKDEEFWRVFTNTLRISVLKLVVGFPMPIIFAICLNELRNLKFKKVIQTVTYLPHFFSWVVLGGMMLMIFSTTGPVNKIISSIAGQPISFFGEGFWYIVLLLVTSVWQGTGWGAIVYIAAISGIDMSLYEAAMVDGASRWRQTINITLPSILPTIITVFILNVGNIMVAGFDQIYNTFNPMVYSVADVIDTYVLRKLQNMNYDIGTAVGLFKSVISLILVVSTNAIVNKLTDGEQGMW